MLKAVAEENRRKESKRKVGGAMEDLRCIFYRINQMMREWKRRDTRWRALYAKEWIQREHCVCKSESPSAKFVGNSPGQKWGRRLWKCSKFVGPLASVKVNVQPYPKNSLFWFWGCPLLALTVFLMFFCCLPFFQLYYTFSSNLIPRTGLQVYQDL